MSPIGSEERKKFKDYVSFVNYILAALMFGVGLQCLSFDNTNNYVWIFDKKEFYAGLSFFFSSILLMSYQASIRHLLKQMVDGNHPYLEKWQIFRACFPFIFANTFLFLISIGKIK